jgi:uncharacterized membrane protein/mono/diheme cytochrome c family protein
MTHPNHLPMTAFAGRLALALVVTAACAASAVPAHAADAPAVAANAALAGEVLQIFKDKCSACHMPPEKKRNKFHYVEDLGRLAANAKFLTPGNPDKSLLWEQIRDDEMPPPDEEIPPLSAAQKETVKRWILAGCPPVPVVTGALPPTTTPTDTGPTISGPKGQPQPAAPRPSRPFFPRLVKWLGNFHPLAAHTPIAMTMAAAIAEILYLKYRSPALTAASRFSMVLGALGAVATGALGWLMAVNWSGAERELLENHRWAGTIAAALTIPIALLGEWGARRAARAGVDWHGASRWVYRFSVFAIAGLVGFAAHIGGLVHWGEDFFKFPT